MRIFDTRIQEVKYNVLKNIVELAYEDKLETAYYTIPKTIVPGPKSNMRCCIYKERAVLEERIKVAMGGDKDNPNIIELVDIACDECPVAKYHVTESCRGCISHRCQDACNFDAIRIRSTHQAKIDTDKCKECGKCAKACPFGAIVEMTRPCIRSCKVGAIKIDDNKKAKIDNDKCVMCGACVYQCPFGALQDKSYILDCIDMLRNTEKGGGKVYAILAPAIVSQFKYARITQVISGIKKLGFRDVVEAALGADVTAYKDALELVEKKILTSSCCPSFVMLIEKHFPQLKKFVSHNVSPMVEAAKIIKAGDPTAKTVFIGPCTAKKKERQRDEVAKWVDCVITFEELQALLDGRKINVEELEDSPIDNASFFGRIFARSGGVTDAVKEVFEEEGIQFDLNAERADGLEQCRIAMLKLSKNPSFANFIEGMACEGGCINGAACLSHTPKNAADVDAFGRSAKEKNIRASLALYNLDASKLD